jgi:hypothetical protein
MCFLFFLSSTQDYPATFRSALHVDPLLAGNKVTIEKALRAAGYGISVADAREYLHDWCDTMEPEYMMVSLDANALIVWTQIED